MNRCQLGVLGKFGLRRRTVKVKLRPLHILRTSFFNSLALVTTTAPNPSTTRNSFAINL
jgi:hypothetical protein